MLPDELYSQVIRDQSQSRHNRRRLSNVTVIRPGKNPTCGDEISLELQVEGGILLDGAFTGVGCAISQASVSIMLDLVREKSLQEARDLAELFLSMARRETLSPEELARLEEAAALANVSNMPARVKCATMPWHTLLAALDDAVQA